MEGDYYIERLDFSNSYDMHRLVALQNAVYKGAHIFTDDLFKYWYLDNPNGHVISYNAVCDDKIAAHYAIIPIQMEIEGHVRDGALSMATVTHPEHQGRGLFKKLAKITYEAAKNEGREFVIGVANANSFPGFIKHLGFYEVGRLDVLFGYRDGIAPYSKKDFKVHWDKDALLWRVNRPGQYYQHNDGILGFYPLWKFKRCPLLHTYLGTIPPELTPDLTITRAQKWLRPFYLYVGLGSNAKNLGYHNVPSFIKHSPFHLIFLDLTDGRLPKITKDNVFFQLMDFDVA